MRQLINSIIRQLIIIGTAGIVIALAGAILVTRSITGPLAVLKGRLCRWGRRSRGQLDHQVPGRDWRSVGFPQGNGRQSAPAGEGVQESSEHVFALSQDLSSMAVETGAAVEEVASTANEFSGTSVTMAQNTEQMRASADQAMGELERGLGLLKTAVGAWPAPGRCGASHHSGQQFGGAV